jgi:hypothetical protein
MRRQLFSWMLVASGVLAARGGQEQDFSKVEIKATKVAGNITCCKARTEISRRRLEMMGW